MISTVIAFDGSAYYDPNSGLYYDDATAASLVQSEHAAGELIQGLDDTSSATTPATTTSNYVGVTDAQNQANLATAAQGAASAVGISLASQSTWTPAQQLAYLQALQANILANPDQFTSASYNVANNMVIPASLAQMQGSAGVLSTTNVIANVVSQAAAATAAGLGGAILASPVGSGLIFSAAMGSGGAPIAGSPPAPSVGQQIANGAQALLNAATNTASAISNATKFLEYALPIALLVFLYYGAKSTGSDPGGQFQKTAKGVGSLY